MDKIYHIAKRAEDAILKSVHELDDEKIFGPSSRPAIVGCDEEVEEIFGSYGERKCDDNERYVLFKDIHHFNIFFTNLKHYFG